MKLNTIRFALSFLIAVVLATPWYFLPAPSQAAEGVTAEIGSASTVTGGAFRVPITIKNFTNKAGLGGYDLQVTFDPSALRVTAIGPGTSPAFGLPIQNINNVEGVARLNGFQAGIPGPTGDIQIASMDVMALSSGSLQLGMNIVTLADTQGSDIPASPVNGIVDVKPMPAIEAISTFIPLERTAGIPIVIKDFPDGKAPTAYSLKVSLSPASIKIKGVRGGDKPYDQTPIFSIDASQNSVTFTGNQNSSDARSKTTIAYLDVSSAAPDKFTANIAIQSLKTAANADVTANVIPGQIWVWPPATLEVTSPTITAGEYEAVSVQLRNIPSIVGLGSYQLELKYDPAVIKVMRVTDYPMPDKGFVQASSSATDNTISASGTITKKPGPVGNVSLLEIIIQGVAAGQSPITANIKDIRDTAGQPMDVAVKPGVATVRGVTIVELGSASLVVGTPGKVAITIRDYPDPDGLGTAWFEVTYPARVMEVTTIEAADIPFDKQPQQQTLGTDAPVGDITITTAPGRIKTTSSIVVATLTVMPLAEGEFRLSLRGGNINNSRNQPISARAVEGTISFKSPFKISNLAILPRQPGVNEKATLTASIVNTGTIKAVYPARLWIGATQDQTGSIELEAGATRNISFGVTREVPGLYKAMIGEADLQFTVVNPADLKPSGLTLAPSSPKAGEAVTITERVENTGKVEAVHTGRLKINQALKDTREFNLKPGEKRDLTFFLSGLPAGDYVLELDGQTAAVSISGAASSQPQTLTIVLGLLAAIEAAVIAFLVFRKRSPHA